MNPEKLDGGATLYCGDNRKVLPLLAANSIDSCVTDPPYALVSISKRFGKEDSAPAKGGATGVYQRASAGFMGKKWDTGEVAFDPETWKQVLRVLKPGGHLLAFGGTRSYHRLVCAIEDAGFEIRDCVVWSYGSGFPKSHNVSKAIDEHFGADREKVRVNPRNPKTTGGGRDGTKGATRPYIEKAMERGYHEIDSDDPVTDEAKEWEGWGTALKPAVELIVLARKPLSEKTIAANVLKWGTGGLNIDACRVPTVAKSFKDKRDDKHNDVYGKYNPADYDGSKGRWPANFVHDGSDEVLSLFPDTNNAPHGPGVKAKGMFGVKAGHPGYKDEGGNASRIFKQFPDRPDGRWPANFIHDGSDDVREVFPDTGPASDKTRVNKARSNFKFGDGKPEGRLSSGHKDEGGNASRVFKEIRNPDTSTNFRPQPGQKHDDNGSAARVFYTAKADVDERSASSHPTVKPIDLLQYLIKLVTPKGGTILDLFAGSGTLGEAAYKEGFKSVLIEREAEYQEDIRRRMATVKYPFKRRMAIANKRAEKRPVPDFLESESQKAERDRMAAVAAKRAKRERL